ncbi:hypothetical protein CVT91_02085 [Candidatus Atribacteria bacterium HGW-Atribacteria-1]|nr:MAG: hypothetical protein CVT91_02085 [Candidatus Atribacteria bacterium HGW-Atribacteria-1]
MGGEESLFYSQGRYLRPLKESPFHFFSCSFLLGDEGISIPRENRDLIYPFWLEGLNCILKRLG